MSTLNLSVLESSEEDHFTSINLHTGHCRITDWEPLSNMNS